MNAASISRLIRRIRSLLKQKEPESQGPQLAQEFASLCQSLSRRLAECEVMLAQNSDYQALQHAESSPDLMQTLALVGFKEVHHWRALCEQRQWTLPTLPDPSIIHRLNELYARLGTEQQRQHRRQLADSCRAALLRRDDEAALPLTRRLLALDPADSETIANLQGVEERVLRARLAELAEGLEKDSTDATVARLEGIEGLLLHPRTDDEMAIWQAAQHVRVQSKTAVLTMLRDADDWATTQDVIGQIQDLAAEHGLSLPPDDQQLINELQYWAAAKRDAFENDQLFADTVNELEFLISQCEQRLSSLQGLPLRSLRIEADALDRKWREAARFDRALPEETEVRYDRIYHQLKAEIDAKSRQRRSILLVSSATAVGIFLIVGTLFVRSRTAQGAASLLREDVARHQPLATSNLLAEIIRDNPGLSQRSPLQEAVAEARAYIAAEYRKADEVLGNLESLNNQVDRLAEDIPVPEWIRLQSQVDAITQTLTNLTADLRQGAQEPYRNLSSKWDAYLARRRQERVESFRKRLEELMGVANGGLAYAHGPAAVAQTVEQLRPSVASLQVDTNPPLPAVALPENLLLQFEDLAGRCLRFGQAAEHWRVTTNLMATATDSETFLSALRSFLTNGFAPPSHLQLAESTLQADFSTNRLFARILFRGKSGLWSAFLGGPELRLHPGELNADEDRLLNGLKNESWIHRVGRYPYRTSYRARDEPERFLIVKVSQGDGLTLSTDGKTNIASVYDAEQYPLEIRWEERPFPLWQLPLNGRQNPIQEARIYFNSGLPGLLGGDSRTNNLLVVMDRLRSETNYPVFRAYLLQYLGRLADHRPTEWGLQWCPALEEHRTQLRQIIGDTDLHGDWLRLGPRSKLAGELVEFLVRTGPVRYLRQATFFHKLAVHAARAGWTYCGHEGWTPSDSVILPLARGRDLYGWDKSTRDPARLYRWSADAERHERLREGLPLSPIYSLGETPRRLVQKAEVDSFSISASEPSIQPWLPSFFTEP